MSACLLASCASQPKDAFTSVFETPNRGGTGQNGAGLESDAAAPAGAQGGVERLNPMTAGRPLENQSSSQTLDLSDVADVTVAFDQVPLKDFVTHSLEKILNVDFVIDPQTAMADKTVTLSLKEPISQQRYLELFKDILEQHELAMKLQNDIMFLFSNRERRGLPDYDYGFGRSAKSVPFGSNPIFQVAPIDFIDAKSLQSFLIRLTNVSPEPLPDPNLLGLRGARHDIMRALDVINLLDRPKVQGQKLLFVKLDYLPSSEFIDQVTTLLTNEGVMVDTAARFTDLSRQNGVIVHSNSDDVLDRVDYWRKQLDTPEATEDRQYFMYYPENMEAAKLADVLEKLVKVADGGSRATGSAASSAEDSDTGSGARATGSRASRGSSGRSDDFSFVTDENRNVIIIYATGSKYKSVLPLLQKLDVTPPQVLIEAKLIEVTLTDQLSQGIEWSMFGGGAKRDMATSQLSSFANGSFSYTISGVDYDVALSLLQNQDRLKVLSSPRIVVANGEKASINVGTEIPVLATQSADVDTDRVLQSIQYRSTGVDLTVEPTVNSSNVISLIISQNVSETSENASSGLDSPIILNRSFKTTVVANSGQALVLGGLIRENNSSKDAQVPFLGDIPGLGKLFSNESRSKSRTELVVLITPRIISNSSDIDDIKRLFIEEFTLMEAGATTATP